MKNPVYLYLIISIIGISLLLLLVNLLEPKLTNIQDINEDLLDKKVKISGQITKIEDKETFKILTIKDETGTIEVLCNCKEIEQDLLVEVTGKVTQYQNTLQIQADKIMRIEG